MMYEYVIVPLPPSKFTRGRPRASCVVVFFAEVHGVDVPFVVVQGTHVSFLTPVESQIKSENIVSQLEDDGASIV
jgi:hypothetical protein